MKNIITLAFMALIMAFTASAQKMEILYFKADMACCRAAACDALENEIKNIFESHFKNADIQFKSVRISDASNKALVEKYNAGSQTVVVVTTQRRNEISTDITDLIRTYSRSRNKANLETELTARLAESTKK
jgi:hypothetical protein